MTKDQAREAIDRIIRNGPAVAVTHSATDVPEGVLEVLRELNIPLVEDSFTSPGTVFFMRDPWRQR